MDCPVCKNVNLVMSDRQGIEIDYCPNCRGVWLDRGELDKIIERSSAAVSPAAAAPAPQYSAPRPQPSPAPGYDRPQQHYDPRDPHHTKQYKKKREGFFSELFDFD